jgi:hypothetical protein
VRVPQNVVDTLASFSCPVMMMMLLLHPRAVIMLLLQPRAVMMLLVKLRVVMMLLFQPCVVDDDVVISTSC